MLVLSRTERFLYALEFSRILPWMLCCNCLKWWYKFITSYQAGVCSLLSAQFLPWQEILAIPSPGHSHAPPTCGPASGKFVASSLALNAFFIASQTGQSEDRAQLKKPNRRKLMLHSLTPLDHHNPRVIYDAGSNGNTEHRTGIISFLIMSRLLLIIPQHDVVNKTTNYHQNAELWLQLKIRTTSCW